MELVEMQNVTEVPLTPSAALTSLLNPKILAIVGASPKPGSFGGAVLRNLAKHYKGKVFPVNPQYSEVNAYRCYPSLAELPERPDCVGIAVPAHQVESVLLQAVACGIPSAIVFSSGFSEIGTDEGTLLQRRITDIATTHGIRVLGPNCTGMVNVRSGASCNILPSIKDLPMVPGDVGLVGQSGALGYVVFQAMHRGVGFSHLISTGNSCDVDIADLIDYLVDDPNTKAIASIFESVPNGRRLRTALERAFRAGKPVVIYKIGVTASGQKAALSHSGMLAGDAATYRALFERTGVIEVDTFEALLETAVFFSRVGKPSSSAIGIISGSGGSVVMAADKADKYGLCLPTPTPATVEALSQRLPAFASIANPADITAESIRDEELYGECVRIFADDPGFAGLAILMPSAHGEAAIRRAEGLDALASKIDKPLSLVWMNEWYEGIGSRVYDASRRISVFRSLDRCMHAYQFWFDYARRQALLSQEVSVLIAQDARDAARRYIQSFENASVLTEGEAKKLFEFYGIDVVPEVLCTTAAQAIAAAEKMGFPVVAKVQAAEIRHKSDVGGVKLSLRDAASVAQAYDEIMTAVQGFELQVEIAGISIQKMVPQGIEMIIGARQDPQFGPIVVFGFGGTQVEVLRDVAVGLAPISSAEVRNSLNGLRMRPLLDGLRGAMPSDIDHFVGLVTRVSELMNDLADEILEIDINPIILHARGGIAVDGLIVRQ
ncbi:acetate--CoA ligase family protein [Pollutimonas bauzanensis]|uniref:acetate--CoA ligase family protein n=1 Tax=Pollutimonas bauzanensis TaxID=658167 RepID=UPI0033417E87